MILPGDDCWALTFDGTYIYAGLEMAPAVVVKIDPATMLTVGVPWTGGVGDFSCYALAFDGTYIYAGVGSAPAVVVKIDPSSMAEVDRWTGGAGEDTCQALTFDGTHIYAGLHTNPALAIKINPVTMATVGIPWTGGAGEAKCWALPFDGTYIYAGLNMDPAVVVKIDPATMLTVGVPWTGTDFPWPLEYECLSLTFDGMYIYAGLGLNPADVIKINPATMLTVDKWTGAMGESSAYALVFDGTYIYAGLDTGPPNGVVIKIDPTTMGTVGSWPGSATESSAYALVFDGTYIYAGLGTSPGQVVKINPITMTTVTTVPPTVITLAVTGLTPGQATLNGLLANDGGEICTLFFEWGTSVALGNTAAAGAGSTGASFSATISLLAEQTYYFRAGATNSVGTSYGAILSLTTPAPPPGVFPTVLTLPAVEVTENGGKLQGFVQDSLGRYGDVRFEWGGTTAYGNSTPWQEGYKSGDAFEAQLLNLAEGAVYHYRAQFRGSGIVSGSDAAFSTLSNLGAVTFVDEETLQRLEG